MPVNMGSAVGYLDLDIAAFSAALVEAQQQANAVSKTIETSFNRAQKSIEDLGKKMQSVGKAMTIGITTPIVAGFTASVKVLADFEATMSRVEALSGATGDELEALSQKAQEMGATTKYSANDAAEAFTYMAQAGWNTSSMLDGISGVMNLAASDGIELAEASSIVTSSLTAFGLEAADAAHFADVLAVASAASNTDVTQLGEAFKYVAPLAGTLGLSIEDVSTALGIMSNNGIVASQAGTTLRSMLSRLAAPTKESQRYMDELGISITNADGSMKSLDEIVQMLRDSFGGLTTAQQAQYATEIFGQEAQAGTLAIINSSVEAYDQLKDAIYDSDGAAQQMATTMQDNLKGRLEELSSAVESIAMNVGEALMPIVEDVVAVLQDWAENLADLDEGQTKFIVTIAALAAAIGPLTIGIGKLFSSMSTIVSVVSAAAGAFKTLMTAINSAIGPVGIAVTLIGLLAAAVISHVTNTEDLDEVTSDLNGTIEEYNRLIATSKTNTDEASGSVDNLTKAQERLLKAQAQQQVIDLSKSYAKQLKDYEDMLRDQQEAKAEYDAWAYGASVDFNKEVLSLEFQRANQELALLEENASVENLAQRNRLRIYTQTLLQMGVQSEKALNKNYIAIEKSWTKSETLIAEAEVNMENSIATLAAAVKSGLIDTDYISIFSEGLAQAVTEFMAAQDAAAQTAKAAEDASDDASDAVSDSSKEINDALDSTSAKIAEVMESFASTGDYSLDLEAIFNELSASGIELSDEVIAGVIAALNEFNSTVSETEEAVPTQQKILETFRETQASIEANSEALAALGLEYDSQSELVDAARTAYNSLLALPIEERMVGWKESVEMLAGIMETDVQVVESSLSELRDEFDSEVAVINSNATALSRLGIEYDRNAALVDLYKSFVNQLLSLPVSERTAEWAQYIAYLNGEIEALDDTDVQTLMNDLESGVSQIEANAEAMEELGLVYDSDEQLLAQYNGAMRELLAMPVEERTQEWVDAFDAVGEKLTELNSKTTTEGNFFDNWKERQEELKESFGKDFQDIVNVFDTSMGHISDIGTAVYDLFNTQWENQLNQIDAQINQINEMYDAQLEAEKQRNDQALADLKLQYQNKEITAEQYAASKNALEQQMTDFEEQQNKERQAKELELKRQADEVARKQFEANKATKIAQVWIDAASATIRAFAENWWPIAIGYAAAIATMAGVQTAAIASQQYVSAFAKGGIVNGPTLGLIGEDGREAIVPLERNTEWLDILSNRLKANGVSGQNAYNITFNSPTTIDPLQASRLMKRTVRDLAEGF